MKVFSALGSPNKKGNTAALLNEYLKGVNENHENVENTSVFLQEKDIKACRGCNACKNGLGNCVIKDDMQQLYKEIKEADIIIFATPVYWWNMTAQLKTFIDRMYALDFEKVFLGKKFTLLMTYGGANPNSGAMIVKKNLEEIVSFLGMDFVHKYGVSTGDYREYPVDKNIEALSDVYNLGKAL